tara:strand:+ start:352 stop:609 length:258 start_codon:yes stop_codon:yes gene_type:complete
MEQIIAEKAELDKDYLAFRTALRVILRRLRESGEVERIHDIEFCNMTHASVGVLRMSCKEISHMVEEYQNLIVQSMFSGGDKNEC